MLLCRCIRRQHPTASPSPVSSTNSLFWRLPSRLDSLSRLMCSNTWRGRQATGRRQAPGGCQRTGMLVCLVNAILCHAAASRQYTIKQPGPRQTHMPVQLASTPSASCKLAQHTHPAWVAQTRIKGSCKVGEEAQAVAHRHACVQGPATGGSVGATVALPQHTVEAACSRPARQQHMHTSAAPPQQHPSHATIQAAGVSYSCSPDPHHA